MTAEEAVLDDDLRTAGATPLAAISCQAKARFLRSSKRLLMGLVRLTWEGE
jgi:hypothetical protein